MIEYLQWLAAVIGCLAVVCAGAGAFLALLLWMSTWGHK